MDINKKKEEIQISCLLALCASMGIDFELIRHDSDSVDAIVKKLIKTKDVKYNSMLSMQLKATSSVSQYQESPNNISYKLKAKNYNDLCIQRTTPIILVLLILPEKESEWINWSEEDILIHCRLYWASFAECEPSNNSDNVTVKIPKDHYLNGDTLHNLLVKVALEEKL